MPRLPTPKATRQQLPTVPLAIILCVVSAGAFFGLLTVILPGVGFLGLAVLLLGLFFWLQYIVWGKWMYAYAVRKEEEKRGEPESEN